MEKIVGRMVLLDLDFIDRDLLADGTERWFTFATAGTNG